MPPGLRNASLPWSVRIVAVRRASCGARQPRSEPGTPPPSAAQRVAELKAATSQAAEALAQDEWSLRHRREKLARVQAQLGRLDAKIAQGQAEWDWDRAEEVR